MYLEQAIWKEPSAVLAGSKLSPTAGKFIPYRALTGIFNCEGSLSADFGIAARKHHLIIPKDQLTDKPEPLFS